jgi:hypothetical protein
MLIVLLILIGLLISGVQFTNTFDFYSPQSRAFKAVITIIIVIMGFMTAYFIGWVDSSTSTIIHKGDVMFAFNKPFSNAQIIILMLAVISLIIIIQLDITLNKNLVSTLVVLMTMTGTAGAYGIGAINGRHTIELDTEKYFDYFDPDEELGTVDSIHQAYVVIESPRTTELIILERSLFSELLLEGDVVMKDLSINYVESFNRRIRAANMMSNLR